MTEHEQHMEVYATAILETLQIIANTLIEAADAQNWVRPDTWANLVNGMSKISTEADKITELRNKVIAAEEPDVAEKYIKLYKDSEDMRSKCRRVVAAMCAVNGIEDDDLDVIEAWSVVRDNTGHAFVMVDYWQDNDTLQTYQFPVAWLEWSRAQLETHKAGCQLHASV